MSEEDVKVVVEYNPEYCCWSGNGAYVIELDTIINDPDRTVRFLKEDTCALSVTSNFQDVLVRGLLNIDKVQYVQLDSINTIGVVLSQPAEEYDEDITVLIIEVLQQYYDNPGLRVECNCSIGDK